jgi:hypothetical protein
MGIDSVRGNIIKRVKKEQEEVGEVTNMKAELKKILEFAASFAAEGEYSSSFFMYYRALKLAAMLYMKEKMGNITGMGEGDVLLFVAQKGLLGLNVASLEEVKEVVRRILDREKISKAEFQKINKVVQALKNV